MRILLSAALLAVAIPASAQAPAPPTRRVEASIDYVSVDGLYLGVGAEHGAVSGDTVRVFADSIAGDPLATIVLVSVTRRRSVGRPLEATPLESGTSVFVELPVLDGVPADAAVAAVPVPNATRASVASVETGARLTGRVSLDLDARTTRTSWIGDLAGERVRRFATPTMRLSLMATDLAGGVTVRANLRGAYRYDATGGGPAPLSVRAYELAVSRTFDAVHLMLGRFDNPYESYSAYWDGALIRVGGVSGPGVGIVAGFEPRRQDEGVSTSLPKLTTFADYAARGDDWRYDSDVSLHFSRPRGMLELGSAGWSQRLSLGPLDLAQRLRLTRASDGRWSVGEARLRATLDVGGPLRLRASYGRVRQVASFATPATDSLPDPLGPVREETSAGLDLGGARRALAVDVGAARRDRSSPALSVGASARWGWRSGRIGLAAQRLVGGGTGALSASPSFDVTVGALSWRASYRFYETDATPDALTTHAVSAEVGLAAARTLHLTVGGERQWGERLSGTRVHFGVWRAF